MAEKEVVVIWQADLVPRHSQSPWVEPALRQQERILSRLSQANPFVVGPGHLLAEPWAMWRSPEKPQVVREVARLAVELMAMIGQDADPRNPPWGMAIVGAPLEIISDDRYSAVTGKSLQEAWRRLRGFLNVVEPNEIVVDDWSAAYLDEYVLERRRGLEHAWRITELHTPQGRHGGVAGSTHPTGSSGD
jgi:hypothetical protein